MLDLFYQGGPLFMGILSLLFLAILVLSVMFVKQVLSGDADRHRLTYIKSVGLFSLVFGILGQLIGLFSAFGFMSQTNVSPTMLMSGIRVSMITTLYGVIIFLIAYAIWMALDSRIGKGEA